MGKKIDDERIAMLMSLIPVRANVRVLRKSGRAVLVYEKNYNRFERFLQRYLKGPKEIQRPLDEMGTAVWDLCDGKHTVGDIVRIMDERYREDIEPAGTRVTMFLENLYSLGLLTFDVPGKPREGGKNHIT